MNENKQDELISIIVPIYNIERYLNRCVQSIVAQTYKNLEIILVDDGSSDRCPQICDDWVVKDNRVKVIHKKNGGLSDARNVGMQVATGTYIGFVDSDDWLAPEMYERLLNSVKANCSDISACTIELAWDNGNRQFLTPQINCVMSTLEAEEALLKEDRLKNPVVYKLYKRELIKGIPFETGKIHEDVFWTYRAIGAAKKISLIDYTGYFYYQRSGSIMGTSFSLKRLDGMEAYCKRYQYLAEKFPQLETKARLNVFANCIYFGQMALKYLSGEDKRKAFIYLNRVQKEHMIKNVEYKDDKITHRIWYSIARISLVSACCLKNMFNVGL